MSLISFRDSTLNGLVQQVARAMMSPALTDVTERSGQQMRELRGPALLELTDPTRNLCTLSARKLDPWVTLCEFPWLIAGRNDVEFLSAYLPRAKDFSDDGVSWRGGYGPRLRCWPTDPGAQGSDDWVDQLVEVIEELKDKPDSRRAVISLWDPVEDNRGGFKDYPCTNWLHFQIRNDRLDLTVTMRSNDLIWGFSGVNATNFTLLQQYVAQALNVAVGSYYHLASNLHVYERHFQMLEEISEDTYEASHSFAPQFAPVRLEQFTKECSMAVENVLTARQARRYPKLDSLAPNASYLRNWRLLMACHSMIGDEAYNLGHWHHMLNGLPEQWQLPARALLARKFPDRLGNLQSMTHEEQDVEAKRA